MVGRVKLIEKELSYIVRGILFEVHNELGRYRNEKQYCDAIAFKFKNKSIKFEREKVLDSSFAGELKGRNRVDFMIENKIILEIKTVPYLSRNEYNQCLRYLTSSDKELALLVNFRADSCIIKRILNPNLIKN